MNKGSEEGKKEMGKRFLRYLDEKNVSPDEKIADSYFTMFRKEELNKEELEGLSEEDISEIKEYAKVVAYERERKPEKEIEEPQKIIEREPEIRADKIMKRRDGKGELRNKIVGTIVVIMLIAVAYTAYVLYIVEEEAEEKDKDGDGIPNEWEEKYGLNPNDPNDADEDPDNDGYDANYDGEISQDEKFTNLEEYLNDTHPKNNDTDNDDMLDGWEVYYGLNPKDETDAGKDLDGDGLTNLDEYLNGGDPTDGMLILYWAHWVIDSKRSYSDLTIIANEVTITSEGDLTLTNVIIKIERNSSIIVEKDGRLDASFCTFDKKDEWFSWKEMKLKSNDVTVSNSTISNAEIGIYFYYSSPTIIDCNIYNCVPYDLYISIGSNPTLIRTFFDKHRVFIEDTTDSDNDGLSDLAEHYLWNTDPNDPDPDGDGLLDGAEIDNQTDPFDPDTDDDGLTDREEVENGTYPLNPDIDNDELSDYFELLYKTDPFDRDTDDDLMTDGWEVQHLLNPLVD
ncbi:MAG: right-handed parallel beta-helix repeat-containing protein, partial [Thermoplasmata archaeon]|nr:right-handed parallel beta-helix repeat-containing protein [Thermoplasmata archaeon]